MKQTIHPKSLTDETNATLEALESEILTERRSKRWPPKTRVRAGGLQPAYGTPP